MMKPGLLLLVVSLGLWASILGCDLVPLVGGPGPAGGAATTASSGTPGGAGGTGGGVCAPVDDGNACTDDRCEGGLTVHVPTKAGSPCTTGGVLCDGKGSCIECFAPSDCPGVDDACRSRTCVMGACGHDFAAAGTPLPVQPVGDCRVVVCDGLGAAISQDDDLDLPDDKSSCTEDVCTAGVPSNPKKAAGAACGVGLSCDANGACVGCTAAAECGTDDECHHRTCVAGVCGVVFTAADTAVTAQKPADCLRAVCDGHGHVTGTADDGDRPVSDGNACTDEACHAGAPAHPARANGTFCFDADACTSADTCQAGACLGGDPVECGPGLGCALGVCAAPACAGTVSLSGRSLTPMPKGPLAAADLDGDGNTDLVLGHRTALHVHRGLGDGTFGPAVEYEVGAMFLDWVEGIALADLDGDGKVDVAAAIDGDPGLVVLLNNGDGTLGEKTTYAMFDGMQAIALGDFDGDGALDVVVGTANANSVRVLRNHGDGTFASGVMHVVQSTPHDVLAADFDGDGKADIATLGNGGLSVLLNNGDGTFAPGVGYEAGASHDGLASADLDGDGALDLVVADAGSDGLKVLLNDGDGTFGVVVSYAVDFTPSAVAVADLNGDGAPDVVLGDGYRGTASVLLNQGAGVLAPKVDLRTAASPEGLVVADLDGDGSPDIALSTDAGLDVRLNRGGGTFLAPREYRVPWPEAITSADLDGDGLLDLAAATHGATALSILFNQGNAVFGQPLNLAAATTPRAIAAADLDGDGAVDLAVVNDSVLSVRRNLGGGTFASQVKYAAPPNAISVIAADLNGDGALDVVVASLSGTVEVRLNTGDGQLAAGVSYAAGAQPRRVMAADMDGDAALDLVVVGQQIAVLRNRGDGTFDEGSPFSVSGGAWDPVVADYDEDGRLDIAFLGGPAEYSVEVLRNNGDGTFTTSAHMTVWRPARLASADFDGDGHVDVIVAQEDTSAASLLRGHGDGTLAAPVDYVLSPFPSAMIAADLDGDGRPDLAVASGLTFGVEEFVAVILNSCLP